MKMSKKVKAALDRRRKEFVPTMPRSGFACVLPGSQNRKKGASAKGGRR